MKNMKMIKKSFGLLTAVLLMSNVLFAQFSFDNKTLMTIGDEKVTVGEFMKVYNKNNTQTAYENSSIEEYLDLFINFKLKVMEAEALKMDTSKAFRRELSSYRKQLAKPYFVDEEVNEALLKEAYERMLKDIRASHILILVDPDAPAEDTLKAYNKIHEIRKEIMNGMDFGDAAVKYSEDPSAKDREAIPDQRPFMPGNRGDVGYFTVFNMVYPFETAAYNTPLDSVSQPVRTRFGYHLVKVTDIQDAMGVAEVAHIFVALRPDASHEDSLRKAEKINNIYKKIQEGMTFEDAVKMYSEDKGSVTRGGKLSKFTSSRVVPEFVETVDKLDVGEISAPIKTRYGFHIVKLISRETPGSFEEEVPKLKERIAKDDRSKKSREAVIAKIKVDNGAKVFDEARNELFQQIDTTIFEAAFVADSLKTMTKPVLKIGDEKYTQYDFAKYLEKKQSKQKKVDLHIYLEKQFNDFTDDMCLDYEDKNLENHYPEFKDLMQEYHDGILLFNLTDKEVWTKAVIDTTGLEEFFKAHRDNYKWGARLDATVYEIKDRDLTDSVRKIILTYESDGEIAQKLAEDSINNKVIIKPGFYEKGDNKYIDKVSWLAGFYGPFESDVENLVVFVKVRKTLPPEPKKLDEARGLVTADYQTYLEDEWVKQLREKYPVVVNEKVLKKLLEKQSTKK